MAESLSTRPSLLMRIRDPQDEEAWSRFVEIYSPLIYGFGRKHGLQDADADDLTQEVLRVLSATVRQLEYDPRRGSFRGWLFTVVRNKFHDLVLRKAKPDQGTGDTGMLQLLHQQAASLDEAGQWWEQEYQQQLFDTAVAKVRREVQPRTWDAFRRTAVDGSPAKEVARELDMSLAAVYLAKGRVIERLKRHIEELQLE